MVLGSHTTQPGQRTGLQPEPMVAQELAQVAELPQAGEVDAV